MNRREFLELLEEIHLELVNLNTTKGHDYSGDENVFSNFIRAGERRGLAPETVLGVYMDKHEDAINTYIRDGQVKSEPIEGRILDSILYRCLLLGMVRALHNSAGVGLSEKPMP